MHGIEEGSIWMWRGDSSVRVCIIKVVPEEECILVKRLNNSERRYMSVDSFLAGYRPFMRIVSAG
jgi:hypothetical protein